MAKLTTLDLSPAPDYGSGSPKRVPWKWSLAFTAIVLLFLMWQCGSALHQGRGLAQVAVRDFHQKLNGGQYEEIYREADEGFSGDGKHEDLVKLLEAVHRKLGDAGAEGLINIRVDATTNGTSIVTQYDTRFARGSAVETFVWIKKNGRLRLYGYNIQSNTLVLN